MNGTTAPRYGHAPQVMFAATRACAERRARETAAAQSSGSSLLRTLVARFTRA